MKRKDTKNHVLLKGETYSIRNGKEMYCFRWTDSKKKRRAIYSTNLKELRLKEKNILVEESEGILFAGNLRVNDIYDKWKDTKIGIKNNTFQNYIYMYETFIKNSLGKYRIKEIRKSDLRKFYLNLYEEKGMKVKTINILHVILYQIFELALEDGFLKNNPAKNAITELKRMDTNLETKRSSLTREEQELFEACLDLKENQWVKPIFMVMLDAGLRVGEVTGLRWKDIDFENGTIDVNHTLIYFDHGKELPNGYKCYYSINTPKTKNSVRIVPMTSRLIEILKQYKEYTSENNLKCISVIDGYDDFAFFSQRSFKVFTQYHLNYKLKRIQVKCNADQLSNNIDDKNLVFLTNFTCHSLRHTAATRLCESGVNTRFIMDVMGHSDIRTTMNIYVDVKEKMKKEEIKKFEEYLNTKD